MDDPRTVWLSENFRLSDFLGNNSVFGRGLANPFEGGKKHLDNAEALCTTLLERALDAHGPLSISYGYISPDFSRRTVSYQDPDKPSHHRWDLGAAADIRCHDFLDEDNNSPALLLHWIDGEQIPYSRLISYSESPFVCVAVSAEELLRDGPRRAMYENCYEGVPKRKPAYIQLHRPRARQERLREIQEQGLPAPWRGAGHPTYHGGGSKQLQHYQVSRYTTALDWCFDMHSIEHGVPNRPKLLDPHVQDNLAAAGLVYDYLVGLGPQEGSRRISILSGFKAPEHPNYDPAYAWDAPGPFVVELSGADTEAEARIAEQVEDLGMRVVGTDSSLLSICVEIDPDVAFDALAP
jgi:hypothetical protein